MQLSTVEAINQLGPYGQMFPEPIFDGIFELIDQRLIGGRHLKLLLKCSDSESFIDAIAFNVDLGEWPKYDIQQAHIAYRLDINVFRNRRTLQLMIEHLKGLDVPPAQTARFKITSPASGRVVQAAAAAPRGEGFPHETT